MRKSWAIGAGFLGALVLGAVMWPMPTVACPSEDSPGVNGHACHWDAAHQGNGMGRSFTAYPDGRIVYDTPIPGESISLTPIDGIGVRK